jgi:hypothetical protein
MFLFFLFVFLLVFFRLFCLVNSVNEFFDFLKLYRVVDDFVPLVRFHLFYVNKRVINHPSEGFVLVELSTLLSLLVHLFYFVNRFSKQVFFGCLLVFSHCSSVGVHPVKPLEAAFGNDALLDLKSLQVLYMFLFSEFLYALFFQALLLIFLLFCIKYLLNI